MHLQGNFGKAGAVVNDTTGVCKIGREVVEDCIKKPRGNLFNMAVTLKTTYIKVHKFYGGPSCEAVGVWDFETGEHRAPTIYDLAKRHKAL